MRGKVSDMKIVSGIPYAAGHGERGLGDLYLPERADGARAALYAYAGPGEQHGIWIEGTHPHRLLPELEGAIGVFLKTV